MSDVELIYFEGRGLAETIRMTLVVANIKFKETFLKSREQFLALHPDLLFHQVPLLRIDGMNLVQSRAIVYYIAKKANLCGHNEKESIRINMLFEGAKDFYQGFSTFAFNHETSEVGEKMMSTFKKYYPIFSQILKDNGCTGYLVGKSLTIADIALLEVVLATNDYANEVLQEYPQIKDFFDTMEKETFFKKYMLEFRKKPADEEYRKIVRKILAY